MFFSINPPSPSLLLGTCGTLDWTIVDRLLYNNVCREAEMREVSEKTNARVAWFSIMSLGICVFVSATQLWYLRHYFQKKKLI
ncbi:unnamed protein product [Cuscuta campestris]|uniref:GOLD domain-containing protein n=1 Tax=Cuscuta campestris TaxID=132261 RepID=A0A484NI79_9ASTE|nr:unnamed protein product [Cuscuta campestris]